MPILITANDNIGDVLDSCNKTGRYTTASNRDVRADDSEGGCR